jgi:hypothetical protein
MKKTTLLFAALFVSASLAAQVVPPQQSPQTPGAPASTESTAGAMKPVSGDWTFEMNFNPFSASPLSLNYVRTRMFMSDDFALRTGLTLGIRSGEPNKTFEYGLFPGVEKHFSGTERLSPYIGAELVLAGKAASSSATSNSVTTTTKGTWADGSNRGYFNLGANVVIGTDFYFSRHIYCGLEAGFGFSLMNYSDLVTSVIVNGGSTTTTTTAGGSAFQLGPNFNSAIRVGFVF